MDEDHVLPSHPLSLPNAGDLNTSEEPDATRWPDTKPCSFCLSDELASPACSPVRALIRCRISLWDLSYGSSGMLTLLWLLPAGMSLKNNNNKKCISCNQTLLLSPRQQLCFPKDRVFSFLTTCPCFPVTRNPFWESDNPLAGGALSLGVPSLKRCGEPSGRQTRALLTLLLQLC